MAITKEVLLNRLNSISNNTYRIPTSLGFVRSRQKICEGYERIFGSIIKCDSIGTDLKKSAEYMMSEGEVTLEDLLDRVKNGRNEFETSLKQDNSGLTSEEERKTVMQAYNKLEHKLSKVVELNKKDLIEFAENLRELKSFENRTDCWSFFTRLCSGIVKFLRVLGAWLQRCNPEDKQQYCFKYAEVDSKILKDVNEKREQALTYYCDLGNNGGFRSDIDFFMERKITTADALKLILPKFSEFLDYLEENVINKIKEPKKSYPINSIKKAIKTFREGIETFKKRYSKQSLV